MISNFSKICLWITGSHELLYATEPYSVVVVLRRIENDFSGLQTKLLKSLYEHSPPDQLLWPSLWFWQIPKGGSQSLSDLDYMQEAVLGCYDYSLSFSVPFLVSDERSGRCGTEFLLKSGEDFYLYYEISGDLVHIDEPIALHDILRVISTERFVGLKTSSVNLLPEHGGPNVVVDGHVLEGWTKNIDKEVREVSSRESFHEHGLYASAALLFQDGSLNCTTQYLVQAEANKYYIWQPTCNEIYLIDKAEGLQDSIDSLNDPSRHLSLLRIESRTRLQQEV